MARKLFFVFVVLGSAAVITMLYRRTHVQPDTCQYCLPFDIVKQIAVTADKSNPIYVSKFQTDYFNYVPATAKKKTIDLYSASLVYGSFIAINGTFELIASLNLKPPGLKHISHLEKISDSPSSWLNISKDANLSLETLLPEPNKNDPVIVIIIGHYPNSSLLESTLIGPIKPEAIKEVSLVVDFLLQKDFNGIPYDEAQKMLSAREYWKVFIGLARIKTMGKITSADYFSALRNLPPTCSMDITDELFKEVTVNTNVKNELTATLISFIKTATPAQQEPVLSEINKLLSAEIRNPALSLDQLYAKYNPNENDYDYETKIRELEDFLKWDKYDYGKQHYTSKEKELLAEVKKVIGAEKWKWNIGNCLEPKKELSDTLNKLITQHAENKEYENVTIQYKQLKVLLNKTK
ncbi:MAG: hypothetical protein HZA48_11425 [Planctomycetes bacterium]|nr:hypothetical protein [Planctomycetota bacterium]